MAEPGRASNRPISASTETSLPQSSGSSVSYTKPRSQSVRETMTPQKIIDATAAAMSSTRKAADATAAAMSSTKKAAFAAGAAAGASLSPCSSLSNRKSPRAEETLCSNPYESVFKQFDADKSDTVDFEELKAMCAALSLGVTNERIQEVMAEVDADGIHQSESHRGELTLNGFHQVVDKLGGMIVTCRAVFDKYDFDKSGYVSTEEFKAMVKDLRMKMSDDQVRDLVRQADADNSGEIDFGEFVAAVASQIEDGGTLGEIYKKAAALLAEAERAGATWVKRLSPLAGAARLARAKNPVRRAFIGAPTNGSYALASEMGTPDDASCYEIWRDQTLGFFVYMNRLFLVLAALSAVGIVGFGLIIGVSMLSAIFGANVFGLSDIREECSNET